MTEPTRVYVDMVGDLSQAGHVALPRAADAAAEVYGPAVETERLHLVARSGAISTTDLIARVLSRSGQPTDETRA